MTVASEQTPRAMRETPAHRLAYNPLEAARLLGVGRTFFDEHVLPELRVVRRGSKVLVPRRELERWLEREAALTLELQR